MLSVMHILKSAFLKISMSHSQQIHLKELSIALPETRQNSLGAYALICMFKDPILGPFVLANKASERPVNEDWRE